MALNVRIAHEDPENQDIWLEGVKLADAGENAPALLAHLKLPEAIGVTNDEFEVTPGGDFIATVGGQNYVINLASVLRAGVNEEGVAKTGYDNSLVIFGIPTKYAPDDLANTTPPVDPPVTPVPASWTAVVTDPLQTFTLSYDGTATTALAGAAPAADVATALNVVGAADEVVFTVGGTSPNYTVDSDNAPGALTGTNCAVTVVPPTRKGKK